MNQVVRPAYAKFDEGYSDGLSRASMHRRRTMGKHKLAFFAFDSAKEKHVMASADDGRDGEVRYVGEIDNSPDPITGTVEFVCCCARTATDQAIALPSPAMNSRRLIRSPRRRAVESMRAPQGRA